jgi:hypothetical protein
MWRPSQVCTVACEAKLIKTLSKTLEDQDVEAFTGMYSSLRGQANQDSLQDPRGSRRGGLHRYVQQPRGQANQDSLQDPGGSKSGDLHR